MADSDKDLAPGDIALSAANRIRAAIDDLNQAFETMWAAGAHDAAEDIASIVSSARSALWHVEIWGEGA